MCACVNECCPKYVYACEGSFSNLQFYQDISLYGLCSVIFSCQGIFNKHNVYVCPPSLVPSSEKASHSVHSPGGWGRGCSCVISLPTSFFNPIYISINPSLHLADPVNDDSPVNNFSEKCTML